MDRALSYGVFAILGFLLILTILYEGGSSFGPCQAWGNFIGGGHGGMHHGGQGWGLSFIAFWALVFILLYLLLRGEEEDSLEVLNKRLARGEISTEEYNRIKKEIREDKV